MMFSVFVIGWPNKQGRASLAWKAAGQNPELSCSFEDVIPAPLYMYLRGDSGYFSLKATLYLIPVPLKKTGDMPYTAIGKEQYPSLLYIYIYIFTCTILESI